MGSEKHRIYSYKVEKQKKWVEIIFSALRLSNFFKISLTVTAIRTENVWKKIPTKYMYTYKNICYKKKH